MPWEIQFLGEVLGGKKKGFPAIDGGNSNIYLCSALPGGITVSNLTDIFSNGLVQPPTSQVFFFPR